MNKIPFVNIPAESASGGLIYPYTPELAKQFTVQFRADDPPQSLYQLLGDPLDPTHIKIPMQCGQIGPTTKDHRTYGLPINVTSYVSPREDQLKILATGKMNLNQRKSFTIVAGTGVGKTVCAMDLIAYCNRTTLVVVHKSDLESQWRDKAKEFLGLEDSDIGLIKGDIVNVQNKKIVIGYIQSLCKKDRYPSWIYKLFGLVIWDEAHKLPADTFTDARYNLPAEIHMALTATPKRGDGTIDKLFAHVGPIVVRVDTVPVKPLIIRVQTPFKLPRVRVYNKKEGYYEMKPIQHSPGRTAHLNKFMLDCEERNEIVTKFISASYEKGRYLLILSDSKDGLQFMKKACISLGIPQSEIGFYVGGKDKKKLEEAARCHIILGTYAMTKEGTDFPHWDTLIMFHPKADVEQAVGRILRKHGTKCDADKISPGYKAPVVLDLVDSDSWVFDNYAITRLKYYKRIEAIVQNV